MDILVDFEEFFGLLNKHKVRYLIVGGYAMAMHARSGFTNEVEIFLDAEPTNAQNVLPVLTDFGFGSVGITIDDLTSPDQVLHFGFAPARIVLPTSICGVSFTDAWARALTASYGEQTVRYISKQDLIANKRAAGRTRDLEELGEPM